MAILREYVCAAHGEFEATKPRCPRGCSSRFVRQEIRTAPGITSGATKRADSELRGLAQDYGMSDIKNGSHGESVMQSLRKTPSFAPSWGDVPHNEPGWSQRKEPPKTFNPSSAGVQPESVLSQVQPALSSPRPKIDHVHRDQR